jgi:hypothetical protein
MNEQDVAEARQLVELLRNDEGARKCLAFVLGESINLDDFCECYGDGIKTFAAEPNRDALGEVRYAPPAREQRHPACRCTNPPQYCSCPAARYDYSKSETEIAAMTYAFDRHLGHSDLPPPRAMRLPGSASLPSQGQTPQAASAAESTPTVPLQDPNRPVPGWGVYGHDTGEPIGNSGDAASWFSARPRPSAHEEVLYQALTRLTSL